MKKRGLSKRETRRKVAEALSQVLTDALGVPEERIREKARAGLEAAIEADPRIQDTVLAYGLNPNKTGLPSMIADMKRARQKRWTSQELEAALSPVKTLSHILPTQMRKTFQKIRKTLPRHGGPGRKEILTPAEKIDACEQIAALHKTGRVKRWQDIFESVAQAFQAKGKKVSSRTIKRIWESRDSLYTG